MSLKEGRHRTHLIAVSFMFVLGNAVITLPPKNADEYSFLGFLAAGVLAVAVCFGCWFLPFNKFIAFVSSVISLYVIYDTFVTFVRFIKNNLLQQTLPFLIAIPFILIILFLSLKTQEVLLKFSLVTAVLSVAIIALFFFSTFKNFKFENIFIYSLPNFSRFLKQLFPYFKGIVLPSVILSVFAKISGFKKGTLVLGFGMGYLFLALTILNSVLLFGINFSGSLQYPYSSAGSTVTFGNLFTRLDGFIYFLYLSSCLVKSSVGIFIIKKSRSILAS